MEAEREAEWIAGAWVKIASKCPSCTSTRKPLALRRELKQRVLQEVRRILRKVLKKAAASNRLAVLDREANLVRCRANFTIQVRKLCAQIAYFESEVAAELEKQPQLQAEGISTGAMTNLPPGRALARARCMTAEWECTPQTVDERFEMFSAR